jgi:hypothetical protein
MQVKIDITAENLIKKALHRYKTKHEAPDMLLGNVIKSMHSNADSATVIRQAVTNSIAEGIRRLERQAMAAESEFASVGQMSLFGDMIPDHKIPAAMKTKSAAAVNAWMENRAQIERDNLDEIRAALERQEERSRSYSAWAAATRQVCEALQRAGLDPAEVSYADAINKAEALHPRHGFDAGAAAKQPLR